MYFDCLAAKATLQDDCSRYILIIVQWMRSICNLALVLCIFLKTTWFSKLVIPLLKKKKKKKKETDSLHKHVLQKQTT